MSSQRLPVRYASGKRTAQGALLFAGCAGKSGPLKSSCGTTVTKPRKHPRPVYRSVWQVLNYDSAGWLRVRDVVVPTAPRKLLFENIPEAAWEVLQPGVLWWASCSMDERTSKDETIKLWQFARAERNEDGTYKKEVGREYD